MSLQLEICASFQALVDSEYDIECANLTGLILNRNANYSISLAVLWIFNLSSICHFFSFVQCQANLWSCLGKLWQFIRVIHFHVTPQTGREHVPHPHYLLWHSGNPLILDSLHSQRLWLFPILCIVLLWWCFVYWKNWCSFLTIHF